MSRIPAHDGVMSLIVGQKKFNRHLVGGSLVGGAAIGLLSAMGWLTLGFNSGAEAQASASQVAPQFTPPADVKTILPDSPAPDAAAVKGVHADMILLAVDKRSLRAELMTWPEDLARVQPLKNFRIAIGQAEGDKEFEGDKKTPEGIYFAQNHIDGSSLPQKYGAMAIPLDFPNVMDQIAKRTGHGIWLHGVDREARIEEAKVTEGCVAFYNQDIAKLRSWLRGHQGAVVIANDVSQINRPADISEVKAVTQQWMDAWKARNPDSYISHYAPDFRFEKHNLASYFQFKKRVFAAYKVMDLSFQNLRIITHPKYSVAIFNQDFHGDKRFTSIGRKVLYWQKEGGQWKIRREMFENRRFEFVKFTDAELALLSDKASSMSSEVKDKTAANPNL